MPSQPSREEQYSALSTAISRVVSPVMLCMALAVWFVHSLGDIKKCAPLREPRRLKDIPLYPPPAGAGAQSTTFSTGVTVMFIVVILVLMVVLTFLIVWLYKSGRTRIIKYWLMIAVFLIFSYVGGLYIFDFCRSRCIPLDWISLVLAVWNFTATGLYAIFGRVPRLINQAYLIVMSALMSYIFRSLPGYAVWIILSALVLWDLFAVLSPMGPLRMLVEAARSQGDELPALVYDTNPVAAGRGPTVVPAKASAFNAKHPRNPAPAPARTSQTPTSTAAGPTNITPISVPPPVPEDGSAPPPIPANIAPAPDAPPASDAPDTRPRRHRLPMSLLRKARRSTAAADDTAPDTIAREGDPEAGLAAEAHGTGGAGTTATGGAAGTSTGDAANSGARARGESAVQVGTIGTHLKLGLGDFVFYSMLVAQASKSGTMTAVVSFVAVLAGLCATLFLVTVYRKALPALPISITAGLLFYVLTRYTVQPFTDNLVPELLFH